MGGKKTPFQKAAWERLKKRGLAPIGKKSSFPPLEREKNGCERSRGNKRNRGAPGKEKSGGLVFLKKTLRKGGRVALLRGLKGLQRRCSSRRKRLVAARGGKEGRTPGGRSGGGVKGAIYTKGSKISVKTASSQKSDCMERVEWKKEHGIAVLDGGRKGRAPYSCRRKRSCKG